MGLLSWVRSIFGARADDQAQSGNTVVDCVLAGWDNGESDVSIARRLSEGGLSNESALQTIELVRSGLARAALYAAGMQPSQFQTDYERNPLFLAAVAQGRRRLKEAPRSPGKSLAEITARARADDCETRRKAVYELGETKDRQVVPTLLEAIADPDIYVRVYAIQALRGLKARESVDALCRTLESDPERLVLTNVIRALADLGKREAVPALIEATRHENDSIRHDAAWALGELRDARAIPALEALLSDEIKPIERDAQGIPTMMCSQSIADQAKSAMKKIGKRR